VQEQEKYIEKQAASSKATSKDGILLGGAKLKPRRCFSFGAGSHNSRCHWCWVFETETFPAAALPASCVWSTLVAVGSLLRRCFCHL
jgi:hypothetical protein